jgi:putative DNA primase/helicase
MMPPEEIRKEIDNPLTEEATEDRKTVLRLLKIKDGNAYLSADPAMPVPLSREWKISDLVPLVTTYAAEYELDTISEDHIWNIIKRATEELLSKGKVSNLTLDSKASDADKRRFLVEEILSRLHIKTLEDTHEILYYRDGIYVRDGEQKILAELQEIAGFELTNSMRSEVLATIRAMTFTPREEFDRDPNLLNFKNGLVNIETGEEFVHSPKFLCMTQMPVEYRPGVGCPQIAKFLKETLDPEQVKVVVKMLGYILLKNVKYEKAFLLVGEGSNGKSTLIKLVVSFVGTENASQVSLQELTADRFASAHLYGKMVNVFADLKADKINDSGYFKLLVSGDRIRAQKKHQQPFEFSNYAKLVFSANRIPDTADDSYAYFRRWVILRFDRTFEGTAKDESLIEKLTMPEELSGLLNMALGGLKRLKAEHGFEHTDIEEIRELYKEGASKIKDFINEQCELDTTNPELTVSTYELHNTYAGYCRGKGTSFLDITRFGEELKALGVKHQRKRKKGSREYVYVGISLKRPSVLGQRLSSFPTKETQTQSIQERSNLPAWDSSPATKEGTAS